MTIIPADTRRTLNATDPRWQLKSILHILTLFSSLLAISLFASAIPQWNANFFHSKGPLRGDWTDGITVGPLAFAFIVTLGALAHTTIAKQPSHPKFTIAITSLILLSLAPTLILAGHGSLFRHWRPPAVRSQTGILKCSLINIFTRDCEPILYSIGELQIVGIAFGTITWFLVFITFLVSLFEHRAAQVGEQRRNKNKGLRRLTLMIGGERRYRDLENGGARTRYGTDCRHAPCQRSRSRQGSKQHEHERRRDHRQDGTKRHYRSGGHNRHDDAVPFAHMREPDMVHTHYATRYM